MKLKRPYRVGTKVKVGKSQNGIIKDFITYKDGSRDYKVLIPGKGTKKISSKRIRRA
jgi:hypothetical protein